MTDVQPPNGNGKLVNSAILTIVARFAMIIAASAVPVAGWIATRGINTVDEISRKLDAVRDVALETGLNVKLIQQTQTLQGAALADHETRMRLLEGSRRR